jgi:hypothetical protein
LLQNEAQPAIDDKSFSVSGLTNELKLMKRAGEQFPHTGHAH